MILPRIIAVAFLIVFLFAVVTYGTTPRQVETRIHECALVQTREGQYCR